MSQTETRIYEGEVMESLNPSSNAREEIQITKIPRRRLYKKWVSNPLLADEDEEDDLNDEDFTDKGQRNEDESGLEKSKSKSKKRKQDSTEMQEMWDSITNTNSEDGDNAVVKKKRKEKTEDDYEIEKLFSLRKKKSKKERDPEQIAMFVEQVIANLEIAVEDDVELNKKGQPAINKLMKLPLLNEALSKKQLQGDFLDHGVLNVLKNWLEPLPDGSLPSITLRSAVFNILNDFSISLDQEYRREQLKKSGLGKVIMFFSQLDEETTSNKRLANELVSKWSFVIYNKTTRYAEMLSPEEREEQRQKLQRRQMNEAPKVSEIRPDFDTDIDFPEQPKCKLAASKGVGRARVPQVMSMDFEIRPESKFDKNLKARVKKQRDDSFVHENILDKVKRKRAERKRGMQAFKISADGRKALKYL